MDFHDRKLGMGGFLYKSCAVCALLLVTACAQNEEPILMNIRAASDGPDEFAILPSKPLETPENLASLPPPTPGGTNRTDPTPDADAIASLGGNPAALNRAGGDTALVARASRFGVQDNIRGELAAADLEYRRDNNGRLLERLFDVNVYYRAYEPQSLDQHQELERFRRAGVWTPSAPPEITR